MLTKTQKVSFVDEHKRMLKSYKVVGIVQLSGVPDRLLQSTKNQLRSEVKFIMGRKTLLKKILESSEKTKKLAGELTGTSAIILSNDDPFELYGKFKSNSLKLSAKPGQTAPEDVNVLAGETSIQPGQTVTDLKSAGIDVQIQKGKVVIAKDKVLVKKGDVIGSKVAKALHTLEILPFKAVMEPTVLFADNMTFSKAVLGISREGTTNEMMVCFRNALGLCLELNIVNAYTISSFITRAYNNALHVGLEAKALDSGIVELLLSSAAVQAAALGSKAGQEAK
ncbi:MAG: 50S ribosomal protein L10 [Candidatus Micrarchaeota archaeon]|nr:50S ribosomal protein L10 [Candidatus Micrarchaeota archaeon]